MFIRGRMILQASVLDRYRLTMTFASHFAFLSLSFAAVQ